MFSFHRTTILDVSAQLDYLSNKSSLDTSDWNNSAINPSLWNLVSQKTINFLPSNNLYNKPKLYRLVSWFSVRTKIREGCNNELTLFGDLNVPSSIKYYHTILWRTLVYYYILCYSTAYYNLPDRDIVSSYKNISPIST